MRVLALGLIAAVAACEARPGPESDGGGPPDAGPHVDARPSPDAPIDAEVPDAISPDAGPPDAHQNVPGCGSEHESCCYSSLPDPGWCDPGFDCMDDPGTGAIADVCIYCGAQGEPCCDAGFACDPGLSCGFTTGDPYPSCRFL